MRIRLLVTAMILAALTAIPAAAQQSPFDLGLADSVTFVIQQPQVGLPTQVVTVQLYTFCDVQTLTGGSAGFSWDNPKFVMESAIWSPEADTSFDFLKLAYYHNSLAETNTYRMFQMVVGRMFKPGFAPSLSRKLMLTYNFRVTDWTATDKFCVKLEPDDFNTFAFVDENTNEYPPIWAGPYCVGFNPTGLLEVDSSIVHFSGVAGGATPPSKTLNVREHAGQNITFAASDNTAWITLNVADSTTPGTVTVNVDPTGLTAGDYNGMITITSAAAVNQATVTVNLHLTQPNRPPVLNTIGNRSTNENQLLQFVVTASDPDGITPTLTTTTLPAGALFVDNHNGTGSFSWTPTYVQAGSYPVTFTASDALLADTETITIT
ncbi:MAG: putative Ig domain-containing protein, partial [candidate division Zixibacteria bacterium]|nr:putative Ig domain-containing protein [candidate division Zixibacteria bacterium]